MIKPDDRKPPSTVVRGAFASLNTAHRIRHSAWYVLALGLLLTAPVTQYMNSHVKENAERDFAEVGEQIQMAVSNRLIDHARVLMSGAALFNATAGGVTREQWRIFTQSQRVDKQLPGIQGLGFSLLIPEAELPQHLLDVRREGFPEYTVRPAGTRDLYSSIIYLEPFSGRNLRAFGYDMFSEPVRRSAMVRARDTDAAALSGKVVLVQETNEQVQAGTLMYVPVYRHDLPVASVEQRRIAIQGWVYSPYRMNDLLQGIMSRLNLGQVRGLHVEIYDGSTSVHDRLLYENRVLEDESLWPGKCLTRQLPVVFNGHHWTLRFTQTSPGVFTAAYTTVWLTLVGGLVTTVLLFTLIRVLLNTRATARQLAAALTLDLRESEGNFRTFFETMTDMVTVATPAGRILFTNSAVTHTLGYTADTLKGMYLLDLHPADQRSEAEAIVGAMFRGERESCPLPLARQDGSLVPVETRAWLGKWNGTDCLFGICKNLSAEQEATQRFEQLFHHNPALMALSAQPDWRFSDVNDAFLKTLGYARSDVIGKTASELGLFPHFGTHGAMMDELQTTKRIVDVELLVRHRDGSLLNGLYSGEMIGSLGREYFLTVLVDITARQRAEEALRQTADRLMLATRAGGVGIWDYDVVNNRLVWDEQMYRLYGLTPEKFGAAYADWQTGLHPDDRSRGDAEIQMALRGERDFDTEFRVLWPGGSVHTIRALGLVQRDAAGQPVHLIGTNWDITEHRRNTTELAELSVIQRELMRLATEFVNLPLERQDLAIDQSLATMGQLIQADRAYLFAYAFDQGITNNTHEWCGPGITAEIDNLQAVPTTMIPDWVEAHQHGNLIHVASVAALPADSNLRQILEPQGIRSLIAVPLMQGATCLGFVGFDAVREERAWRAEEVDLLRVLAEIYAHFQTRRTAERQTRELQQCLAQARDEAQAAALAKSLFLGNMSHEIRTPLNAILGYAQIMEHECHACPVNHRLGAITRSGEHLLELITDLLELVRSDARVITLAPSTFDLSQMLEDVRMMFVLRPEAQGLTLAVSQSPDVPQLICADQGKIRQVLVNLLGNAVKFTESGSVCLAGTLLADSATEGLTLAVDVTDTGRGISPNDIHRIFELFEQATSSQNHGQGAGLGLPLSRRYARALGGDLTATSQPGVGSRFRFTFKAHAADAAVATSRLGGVTRLAPDQRPLRLLVVDDDPACRDMLATMLTTFGLITETAASVALALSRLDQAGTPELLLLDKQMPEMDGYTAIGHLRKRPGGRDLRILIVTASGLADEREHALAAGADGYVPKPVRREQLLAEIGRVTGLRYEYAPTPASGSGATAPAELDATALARLPAEARRLLDQALRGGDIRQLRELVAAIACEQAGLAASISRLVDAYAYDLLHRLLAAAQQIADSGAAARGGGEP